MIVYLPDMLDDDIDEDRLRQSADMCAVRGYAPVAFVRERPGQFVGLEDALAMVRRGEADRIVMASGADLPEVLESATGGLPGRWLRQITAGRAGSGRHRRTRPKRRGGGGA